MVEDLWDHGQENGRQALFVIKFGSAQRRREHRFCQVFWQHCAGGHLPSKVNAILLLDEQSGGFCRWQNRAIVLAFPLPLNRYFNNSFHALAYLVILFNNALKRHVNHG